MLTGPDGTGSIGRLAADPPLVSAYQCQADKEKAVAPPDCRPDVDCSRFSRSGETARPGRLQAYSRQLESDLRALPAKPKVSRASTVATMSEIEDRIAAIDYQLNDPTAKWAEGDKEIFWGERVRLMKLLLQLRYAQAQRAAF